MSAKVKNNDIFASGGRKKKRGASLDVKKARAGWLFVLPFIIGFVLLYLPIIYDSIKYSFHDIRILTGGGFKLSWVGFENYSNALFVDPNFVQKLGEGITLICFSYYFIPKNLSQTMRKACNLFIYKCTAVLSS